MRCLVSITCFATFLLLVGCGGGGGKSEGSAAPTASVESLYQDIDIASRKDHQVLGILADATTGDFVAPEYSTVGVSQPTLSGALFRVESFTGSVRLNSQGFLQEIRLVSGERVTFSQYTSNV